MLTRYDDNVVSLRKKIIKLIMNSNDGFLHVKCPELYRHFGTDRLKLAISSLIEDEIVKYRDSEGTALEFVG